MDIQEGAKNVPIKGEYDVIVAGNVAEDHALCTIATTPQEQLRAQGVRLHIDELD